MAAVSDKDGAALLNVTIAALALVLHYKVLKQTDIATSSLISCCVHRVRVVDNFGIDNMSRKMRNSDPVIGKISAEFSMRLVMIL